MASIAPSPHTRGIKTTDDWITPQWLVERIGTFDLDPCESEFQPWPCASKGFKKSQCDGLNEPWHGQVWLNPPYGKETGQWLKKLAQHGNGVALVFARTETQMFFDHVWPYACALLFLEGRLTFCRPESGDEAEHNSGGPSVLIAYGEIAAKRIQRLSDLGALVRL